VIMEFATHPIRIIGSVLARSLSEKWCAFIHCDQAVLLIARSASQLYVGSPPEKLTAHRSDRICGARQFKR
jgi:hypothetical protein